MPSDPGPGLPRKKGGKEQRPGERLPAPAASTITRRESAVIILKTEYFDTEDTEQAMMTADRVRFLSDSSYFSIGLFLS
jgi:hypothetical protein